MGRRSSLHHRDTQLGESAMTHIPPQGDTYLYQKLLRHAKIELLEEDAHHVVSSVMQQLAQDPKPPFFEDALVLLEKKIQEHLRKK